MAEREVIQQQEKAGQILWDKFKGLRTTIATSNKNTFGEIGRDLGVNTNWLESQGGLGNKDVYLVNKKDLSSKRQESYDWGEPRVGDSFGIERNTKFDGEPEFHLYRYRAGSDSITFIVIPDSALGEKLRKIRDEFRKKTGHTRMSLNDLSTQIESQDA